MRRLRREPVTVIANARTLARTPERAVALDLAAAALAAIDTRAAVRSSVRLERDVLRVRDHALPLSARGRLLLVAVGKCAAAASAELAAILGSRIVDGIVLDVEAAEIPELSGIRGFRGTHPMPSARNVEATREIVRLLDSTGADDLVLAVVSGGGSTLLALPPDGWTVEHERALLEALFRAGAAIEDINTVRKHTSLARGGQLARRAHPARVVALIFSDVPGSGLDVVASGPTVRDPTTVADAARVLAGCGDAPVAARARRALVETPKESRYFERVHNVLVVSNDVALRAAADRARAGGWDARIVTTALAGEAREVAARVVDELHGAPPGTALLYGGETTVTVRGGGRGGRNLELALAALRAVADDELVLALATDGADNGRFAGAIADRLARGDAARAGLDADQYLADNDSYRFFERAGSYLETGATGSNVADLVIALKSRR